MKQVPEVRQFVIHQNGNLTLMADNNSLHVALVESLDVSLRKAMAAFGNIENVLIILGCVAIALKGNGCDVRSLMARTKLSRSTLDRRVNEIVRLGHAKIVVVGRRHIIRPSEKAIATVFAILAERYANIADAIADPPNLET